MVKVVDAVRFWHFDDSMPAIREADLWQTGDTNTILVQGLDNERLRSFVAKSADILVGKPQHFSSHKNCGGLLIYYRSLRPEDRLIGYTCSGRPSIICNIAVYVAYWRRCFRIWLREGSQVLPGKTPYLPQIFHRRIDSATRGRRLPEQTPPGFLLKPL